jgi:hypothetical protein
MEGLHPLSVVFYVPSMDQRSDAEAGGERIEDSKPRI